MPQDEWIYFTALSHISFVLKQSGTNAKEYGSMRIASLHISSVLRLSGISLIHTGIISSRPYLFIPLGPGKDQILWTEGRLGQRFFNDVNVPLIFLNAH